MMKYGFLLYDGERIRVNKAEADKYTKNAAEKGDK